MFIYISGFIGSVTDYHPLQQGLRLLTIERSLTSITVTDYHPLQQGLRHDILLRVLCLAVVSQTIIHYNKD